MDTSRAAAAFAALSQETRLAVLRFLVGRGREGALAGEVGAALGVRQNTMSAHLGVLRAAGLVRNTREGRGVRYAADLAGIGGLIAFLMEDCCGGRPGLCRPLIAEITSHADGDSP